MTSSVQQSHNQTHRSNVICERMVCDWRDLNRITIKNQACLTNIDDLFDAFQGSTYFTKLDLRSGYNQIRIEEAAIPRTITNTPSGHFQFTVMGFGLTYAPATFQTLMKKSFSHIYVNIWWSSCMISSFSANHGRTVSIILEMS